MSIRTEVNELANELTNLGDCFFDGDKESAAEYITIAFNIIKEGSDIAKVPQEERLKAVALAFAMAASNIAENSIKFSDETVDE